MDNINPNVSGRAHVTPKDFFLQLGAVITLYVSVVSLLTVLFEIINKVLPDALNRGYYDPYSSGLRMAIAALFVLFPVFLFFSWLLERDYRNFPQKREMSLRKWLANLTIFAAAAAIIISLITLINSFLGGELTSKFLLKVLAVIAVSAAVFGYYFYDLRRDMPRRHRFMFAYASIAVVVLSLVAGFIYIGSPNAMRNIRLDGERVNNLMQIQSEIFSYYSIKGALPNSLSDMKTLLNIQIPSDPDTGDEYLYKKTGENTFELCASFAEEGNAEVYYEKGAGSWNHPAGEFCFNRTIDPALYSTPKIRQ